ncbi:hypothetical protein BaRGS_00007772 [Batillaria attramentaria]|uniref:Uncharacterized protein n=1 Tax=Batillaria attramentaria TaxID=370345 RepID=A0ABD0LPA2_9CAEN
MPGMRENQEHRRGVKRIQVCKNASMRQKSIFRLQFKDENTEKKMPRESATGSFPVSYTVLSGPKFLRR